MSDIHLKWKNRVRPKVNETLANEEDVESIKGDEGESEEERPIAGQKAIYNPTSEEWDNHMRTHIPFRRWCPFCVMGKCKSNSHGQKSKSSEELERDTPVISFDYMGTHAQRTGSNDHTEFVHTTARNGAKGTRRRRLKGTSKRNVLQQISLSLNPNG